MKKIYRVSIETVIEGSREEPIDFECKSEDKALIMQRTLCMAPDMLHELELLVEFLTNMKLEETHQCLNAIGLINHIKGQ